jgi:hypothetical protein
VGHTDGGGGPRERAGPRHPADLREREGEGVGQAAPGGPRASRPKSGWVAQGGRGGGKQAAAGLKGERERFSFLISSYFLFFLLLKFKLLIE